MRAQKKILTFLCLILTAAHSFARQKSEEQVDFYELAKSGSARVLQKALRKEKSAAEARYGAKNDTLLMAAIEAGREASFLGMLLDSGVPPDAANDDGDTALIYAAKFGYGRAALKAILSYAAGPAKKRARAAHRNNLGQTAADFVQDGTKEKKFLERYAQKESRKKKPSGAEENQQEEIPTEGISETQSDAYMQADDVSAGEHSAEETQPKSNSYEENPNENSPGKNPESEPQPSTEAIPQETESVPQNEGIPVPDTDAAEQKKSTTAASKKRRESRRAYLFDGLESFDTYFIPERKFEPIQNPDAKDANGRTPLQNAAALNETERVKTLLASGARVDMADGDGWTALMYAARFSQKRETASALIQAGASVMTKNRFGANALEIAAAYGTSADVLDEIAAHSEKAALVRAFFTAVGMGRSRHILAVFFKHGITANAVYKGKTPLMLAAQTNIDTDCIEFLLENGADKTFVTADRKDAYYFAKRNPNLPRNDVFWSLNNSGN